MQNKFHFCTCSIKHASLENTGEDVEGQDDPVTPVSNWDFTFVSPRTILAGTPDTGILARCIMFVYYFLIFAYNYQTFADKVYNKVFF